jgi:hypothetical protein
MRGGGAERDLKSEVLWVRVFEVMQRVRTAKGASASTRDRARARACGSVGGRDDRIMREAGSVGGERVALRRLAVAVGADETDGPGWVCGLRWVDRMGGGG